MDQGGVGKLEVFDSEGVSFFDIGAENGRFFEESGRDVTVFEGRDLGGEGGLGNRASGGEVFAGVGVEIAGGVEVGKDALTSGGTKDGLGCFEMAEVVGAVKEVIGSLAEMMGFEEIGLLVGKAGFDFHDEVDAVVVVGGKGFDARGLAVGFKIEQSKGVL